MGNCLLGAWLFSCRRLLQSVLAVHTEVELMAMKLLRNAKKQKQKKVSAAQNDPVLDKTELKPCIAQSPNLKI